MSSISPDCQSVYDVPQLLYNKFQAMTPQHNLLQFQQQLVIPFNQFNSPKPIFNVAIIGKYISLQDSYISIVHAIEHAALYNNKTPNIIFIDSEQVNYHQLPSFNAIILAPGFGERGLEGKIQVAEFCRTYNIKTLGICFGFQAMAIEYARNVTGIQDATSTEISTSGSFVITNSPQMYKGNEAIHLTNGISDIYSQSSVVERNRHRYELNPDYHQSLVDSGLTLSGVNNHNKISAIELHEHPFYIGVQYHPEFNSRPFKPHPLFIELIK